MAAAPATGPTISGSGYSFAVPDGWSVPDEASVAGADVMAGDLTDTDGFTSNVNVLLSGAKNMTPDYVESTLVDELEGGGASDVRIRNRVIVGGSESAHLAAVFSSAGVDYQVEQFFVSTAEETYVVTFSFSPSVSEPDRDALAESVMTTWAWA